MSNISELEDRIAEWQEKKQKVERLIAGAPGRIADHLRKLEASDAIGLQSAVAEWQREVKHYEIAILRMTIELCEAYRKITEPALASAKQASKTADEQVKAAMAQRLEAQRAHARAETAHRSWHDKKLQSERKLAAMFAPDMTQTAPVVRSLQHLPH